MKFSMKKNLKKFGETYVSTVDGSVGTKGFVTDVIKNFKQKIT